MSDPSYRWISKAETERTEREEKEMGKFKKEDLTDDELCVEINRANLIVIEFKDAVTNAPSKGFHTNSDEFRKLKLRSSKAGHWHQMLLREAGNRKRRAANNHHALVEALEAVLRDLESMPTSLGFKYTSGNKARKALEEATK